MDGWHFALYAFAVYLAVRILIGLMRMHEQELRRNLVKEAKRDQNLDNSPIQV